MKNSWKTIAIIFIVLFIVETIIFFGLLYVGTATINKENQCAINVCADYDAYIFDYDDMCYCYRNNEIVYQEYLG